MSRIERAREFRDRINANLQATRKLIRVDELSVDELIEMIDLYPQFIIGITYNIGDVFKFNNKLYKVIQAHTSQEDWIPSELPAIYLNLLPDNIIPEWKQPTMAEDAYNIGDKVIYNGKVYESLINANTTVPGTDERWWRLIED